MTTPRLRFSPAPTGYLHVGSARSALFNWLYARRVGGTFVLRIEDTDVDRSTPELIGAIHDSLGWLGIDWDEEYRQSDRFDAYRAAAADMLERGLAYHCDCSQDDVKARNDARGDGSSGYDGHCRERGVQPGDGVVVRFRTPDEGVTGWDDLIRGRVEFDNAVLEDFVIVRSTGVPMFHVANAWDDLDMGITHVVRGEDLVNTTPRVLLLRQAMGATDQPMYAHLPLIVNEQRKKLSKRRDDVSVGDYRERGFLPEAMRNYLVTLGWGDPDGQEIRPIDEIIERFDLAAINKAPAFFDVAKLESFNAEYIRALDDDVFLELIRPYVSAEAHAAIVPVVADVKDRCKRLDGAAEFVDWVVGPPAEPVEKDWKKHMGRAEVPEVLDAVVADLEALDDDAWTAEQMEAVVMGVGARLSTEDRTVRSQMPVRLALTGQRSGLPLWTPMVVLGRDAVLDRLRDARARLDA